MSQTRANVIFLAVLLLLLAPGAIILVRKKLDPQASQMAMPEFVRHRLPFMAPFSGEVSRYVPPLTGQWLEGVCVQRDGRGMLLIEGLPVVSEDRALQVAAVSGGRITVLLWEEGAVAGSVVAARFDDVPAVGEVSAIETIPVPEDVRRELMRAGYPKPPGRVGWAVLSFDREVKGKVEIRMEQEGRAHVVRFLLSPES